jgi:hypothetical protein
MHGNRFLDSGVTRANDILDGFEQSQARIEQLLDAGEFEPALAMSEDLGFAIRHTDLPSASITAKDRTRLGDLVRRNTDSVKQVAQLMENARSARRKSQAALQVYKKY